MRRFRASLDSELGIPTVVTQAALGHANVSTTLGIYTYAGSGAGRAAAALVDAALRRKQGGRMTRTQRFGFWFEVGIEFLSQEPALAAQWVDARREEFAKVRFMHGPRGGAYRLVTPPDEWRTDHDLFWRPNVVRYVTKRWGRYVRPDRLKAEDRLPDVRLRSFTIPVRDGKAVLPNGGTVETESKWIVVPIPPAVLP